MKPEVKLMLEHLNSTQENLSALLDRADQLIAKLDHIGIHEATSLYFIGNGSSGEDAVIAANLAVKLLNKLPHCCTPYAFTHGLSEVLKPGDIVVAISQTGTSHEVVESLRLAKKKQAVTIALSATDHSPVMAEAAIPLLLPECVELVDYKVTGVLGLLYGLWIVILALAYHNRKLTKTDLDQNLNEIKHLNAQYDDLVKTTAIWVQSHLDRFDKAKTLTVLGSGDLAETASEFAIKAIEVENRFCVAVDTEEFLHGVCAANPVDNLIIMLVDTRSSAYSRKVYDAIVSRGQNVLWIGQDAPKEGLRLELIPSQTYSTALMFPVVHACIITWAMLKDYGDHGAEVFADYQKKLHVRET